LRTRCLLEKVSIENAGEVMPPEILASVINDATAGRRDGGLFLVTRSQFPEWLVPRLRFFREKIKSLHLYSVGKSNPVVRHVGGTILSAALSAEAIISAGIGCAKADF
jgi:hypothetical protein